MEEQTPEIEILPSEPIAISQSDYRRRSPIALAVGGLNTAVLTASSLKADTNLANAAVAGSAGAPRPPTYAQKLPAAKPVTGGVTAAQPDAVPKSGTVDRIASAKPPQVATVVQPQQSPEPRQTAVPEPPQYSPRVGVASFPQSEEFLYSMFHSPAPPPVGILSTRDMVFLGIVTVVLVTAIYSSKHSKKKAT